MNPRLSRALAFAGAALCPHLALAQTSPGWTLDEIVVTGEREPDYAIPRADVLRTGVPIFDTPQSVQVLTRTLLDEQALTTLADALVNVSGVVPAAPSEAVLANPIVRGFESEIYLDGLPLYGDTAVADPSSLIGVERVEVAKGPTSTLFGGGTGAPVGGLINLVSRQPLDKPHVRAQLRAGSFGVIQPSLDLNRLLSEAVAVRLAGDYMNSGDAIDKVDIERITLAPSLRARLGARTGLLLLGSYNRIEQLEYAGMPTVLARNPAVDRFRFTGASDAPPTTIENLSATVILDHDLTPALSLQLKLRHYASDMDENASFPYLALFPLQGTSAPIVKARLPASIREWTTDASLIARIDTGAVRHVVLAGVQYDATDYDAAIGFDFNPIGLLDFADPDSDVAFGARPATPSLYNNHYRTQALYIQDQAALGERVNLLAALRYTRLELNEVAGSSGADEAYEALDPRIGASVEAMPGVALFAGYATGTRLTLFFSGSQPPRPETSQSAEAGIKFARTDAGLSGTIAGFWSRRDHVPVADADNPGLQVQTGRQRARGIEADMIWEPTRRWSLLASYALTDTRDEDSDDALPRVPRHSGRVALRYRPGDKLGLGLGVTAASAAQITLPNSDRADAYATVDAQANYTLGPVELGLAITNLLGADYLVPYQYLGQSVVRPGTPRSAFVTAALRY